MLKSVNLINGMMDSEGVLLTEMLKRTRSNLMTYGLSAPIDLKTAKYPRELLLTAYSDLHTQDDKAFALPLIGYLDDLNTFTQAVLLRTGGGMAAVLRINQNSNLVRQTMMGYENQQVMLHEMNEMIRGAMPPFMESLVKLGGILISNQGKLLTREQYRHSH